MMLNPVVAEDNQTDAPKCVRDSVAIFELVHQVFHKRVDGIAKVFRIRLARFFANSWCRPVRMINYRARSLDQVLNRLIVGGETDLIV